MEEGSWNRRTSLEAAVDKNAANDCVISTAAGRVAVHVIHTDEKWMIANKVCRVLGLAIEREHHH
jgi:acetate kinase